MKILIALLFIAILVSCVPKIPANSRKIIKSPCEINEGQFFEHMKIFLFKNGFEIVEENQKKITAKRKVTKLFTNYYMNGKRSWYELYPRWSFEFENEMKLDTIDGKEKIVIKGKNLIARHFYTYEPQVNGQVEYVEKSATEYYNWKDSTHSDYWNVRNEIMKFCPLYFVDP